MLVHTSFTFTLMTIVAFSRNIGKLFSELKLVIDNLCLYFCSSQLRSHWKFKRMPFSKFEIHHKPLFMCKNRKVIFHCLKPIKQKISKSSGTHMQVYGLQITYRFLDLFLLYIITHVHKQQSPIHMIPPTIDPQAIYTMRISMGCIGCSGTSSAG